MKRAIRKTLKWTGYTLGVIVSLLLIYVGMAWLLPRIAVNKNAPAEGPDEIAIFIKTNGVHTDIVVPVKNEIKDWTTQARLSDTESRDTAMRYASFGWGDKGFYLQTPQWSDLKFSVAFKAMFHLGSSALHVTFFKKMNTGDHCKEILISREQYKRLVRYISESFRYDANGNTINIPSSNDGYGRDDAFYESPGVYDLFHTCNTWANNALKACGQRACLWTATDKGIFYQYR